MNKIDFVFPYVDCNDPVWQKVYKEERRKNNLSTEISKVRFREWGNLKYLFRGIEKYAPWIGNVYMIVSNKEQVPDWVNTDEVHIVLHKDIIPEEFLPTFNSTTIEMFLGNIKGLSERFIYSNDDMFFLNDTTEDDFYVEDRAIPKLSVKNQHGLETMFKKVQWKTLKTISDHFEKKLPNPKERFLKLPHIFLPLTRETVRVVEKIFKNEIYNSCTQFRTEKNFNQYIYTYYQLFSGVYDNSTRTYKYFGFKKDENPIDTTEKIVKEITNGSSQAICINDCYEFKSDAVFEFIKNKINSAFETKLSKPSKYELGVENIYEKKLGIFKWLNKIVAEFNFKKDYEIDMFISGVVEVIENIKKKRIEIENGSDDDGSSSEINDNSNEKPSSSNEDINDSSENDSDSSSSEVDNTSEDNSSSNNNEES